MAAVLAFALGASSAADGDEDHRAWQHGVDLVRMGGRLLAVWSSPGNPPAATPGGDWQHDIYYSWLDPDAPAFRPQVLVSNPEAQEPASAAVNASGTLLVTSEDGNGGIHQHAGLWDASLRVVRGYPLTIRRGGHSGHVAAMGHRFVVAYSEGWVDGGGFLGRGTGKDVHVRIVDNDGTLQPEARLTEPGPGHRDGWPLVAASNHNALVVWQRYPELSLQAALIAADGSVSARRKVMGAMPVRYAYDVEYAAQLERYVVAGASGEGGFVSLVDLAGNVVANVTGLPPMASESRIVLGWDGTRLTGAYPVRPNGVAVVRITAGSVSLEKVVAHPHPWDYTGTTGTFVAPGRVLFVTLSKAGVLAIPVDLQ